MKTVLQAFRAVAIPAIAAAAAAKSALVLPILAAMAVLDPFHSADRLLIGECRA